jgi:hypothetical protein
MDHETTFLGKVLGAEPETFVMMTLAGGMPTKSSFFTEPELRKFFQDYGKHSLTQWEVDSAIEDARTRLL